MRLVLVGETSFIAQHVYDAARAQDIETIKLARVHQLSGRVGPGDVIVNFTINPEYQRLCYDESNDCDLAAARAAASAGARAIMLSTRRVYSAEYRWDAHEDSPAVGDETQYGRNKARTEKEVLSLNPDNAIFRLANIFGFEYRPGGTTRRLFFAQMMRTLKEENIIRFDMDPETKRDFLPVKFCAAALTRAIREGLSGIHNLGSGFATPCGNLAQWLFEGYGSGSLIVESPSVRDEFFLNMDQWTSRFGSILSRDMLREYCLELGRALKCGRS